MHILESEKVTHVLEKVSEGEFFKDVHSRYTVNISVYIVPGSIWWEQVIFDMSGWLTSFQRVGQTFLCGLLRSVSAYAAEAEQWEVSLPSEDVLLFNASEDG